MKITKGQLRRIIREELLHEQAKTPKMPVTARDAVRQELLRQAKEMRQIQRRIEELEPHIEELEAEYDRLMAENESFEEVDFDSMPQAEELLALYDARRNVRGVAVSDIVRAQQP